MDKKSTDKQLYFALGTLLYVVAVYLLANRLNYIMGNIMMAGAIPLLAITFLYNRISIEVTTEETNTDIDK